MGRFASIRRRRSGMVMVVAMIFIAIFSALAMSMAAMSGSQTQIAVNQIHADRARACAESGQEVIRYWFGQVTLSGRTPADQRLERLASALQTELIDQAVTNLVPSYDSGQLVIPSVSLNSAANERFEATISQLDVNTLQVDVSGWHGEIERTIHIEYEMQTRAHSAFDYGIATRGPLDVQGSVEIDDVNVMVTSNTYIESMEDVTALTVGNAAVTIEGEVQIANPLAIPNVHPNATIGGDKGEEALDHIHIGVPLADFPEPDPEVFEECVTLTDLTPSTDKKDKDTHHYSSATVLQNIRVPAGYNPSFSGHTTIQGVLFIEPHNVVTFTGGSTVTGVIVGNGDCNDDSYSNRIIFSGTTKCYSYSVTTLTDPKFAGLADKTGTFIMAPGFLVDFGGNFGSVAGTIAGNGIKFSGNAGVTVQGSVINYANEKMTVQGNGAMHFNRSTLDSMPAGFVPQLILKYKANTYREQVL